VCVRDGWMDVASKTVLGDQHERIERKRGGGGAVFMHEEIKLETLAR